MGIIQLRHKQLDDRARVTVQRDVLSALAGWRGVLCINDRADLARLAQLEAAPGLTIALHLGQDDMPPAAARAIVGQDVLIGWSTHTVEQVRAAHALPVDYLGFGPVFETTTKANPDATVGLADLKEAVVASRWPLVAIGGITAETVQSVRATGVDMVAVASALVAGGVELLETRALALQKAMVELV
ncbi:MAG: thiamine-phosphate pyrophosphorylase [Myxococcota bacterium]